MSNYRNQNVDYKDWLYETLKRKMLNNAVFNGYDIHVFNEQDFVKIDNIKSTDILIVVKDLPTTFIIGGRIAPKQIMILSEENGLNIAKILFDEFTRDYNYYYEYLTDNNENIKSVEKHEYTSPTVVNNFLPVLSAYRSILYVSVSLTIAENVVDISDFKIDGVKRDDIIATNLNYVMTPDTQPTPTSNFVSSVKHLESLALSLTIPAQKNDLTEKIFKIMNNQENGNVNFRFSFMLCGYTFNVNMKLTSCNFARTISNIPSIQVGFTL